MKNTGRS